MRRPLPGTLIRGLPDDRFDERIVSAVLGDPKRLRVMDRSTLLDQPDLAFDRWTALVARAVDAPVCLLSLVTDSAQHFVSRVGMDLLETPLSHSFCQYVVSGGRPLSVEDARHDPALESNGAISDLGVVAYLGVPVMAEGQILGALCAIESIPRAWTARDVQMLEDAAEAAGMHILLRLREDALRRGRDVADAQNRVHELISRDAPLGEVLEAIGRAVERRDPDLLCSVLRVDHEHGTLHHAAGARMPRGYTDAIEGIRIGPDVGTCGRVASLGEEVMTSDIAADPRWKGFAAAALDHGLRHCWSVPIRDGAGEVLGTFALYGEHAREPTQEILAFIRDCARLAGIAFERHQTSLELAHKASHDGLTGLANRRLLLDRLATALEHGRRDGRSVSVLHINLDRLKLVNDTLGQSAGDEILRTVARRIVGTVRGGDVVARFGGDEFVVVPEHPMSGPAGDLGAQRLLDAIAQPIRLESGEVATVTASIGSVTVDAVEIDAREALRRASNALSQAKGAGGGRHHVFDALDEALTSRRHQVERELHGALGRGEFHLVYQPIVDLADGRVDAVEALIRWESPRLGIVGPDEFIPVAEETGLINPIGAWVLETAARELAAVPAVGGRPLRLNVNVSAVQLGQGALPGMVAAALKATGLGAARLRLEITETALLHADGTTRCTLAALRDLGVEIVLDDFGTGYSSLASLKEHAIHALKIDRLFVAGLGDDTGDSAIVSAVVGMAHGLDHPVTAEGIETAEQLAILRELRCTYGQGYFLGRPAPLAQLDQTKR